MTSRIQKLALVLAALLALLLLLEVVLQIAAFTYKRTRSDGLDPGPSEALGIVGEGEEYRILALGESTTARYGGIPDYPTLLRRELDRQGFGPKFRVFNGATPGVSTPYLVDELPALLELHDPHMVIVMMGINDALWFGANERAWLPASTQRVLLRSRVYRLLRLLLQRWSPRENPGSIQQAHETIVLDSRETFSEVTRYLPAGDFAAAEEFLSSNLEAARSAAEDSGATKLGAYPLALRAAYLQSYRLLIDLHKKMEKPEATGPLLLDASRRHPNSEVFHRLLVAFYLEQGDEAKAASHQARADALARLFGNSVTRASYRAVAEALRAAGVRMVAMQYPMRDVETLRTLFDRGSDDIIFVSNRELFEAAVAEQGYDYVFADRFAGDFGHATGRGNAMIARNLVDVVFEPMFAESSDAGPPE